MQRHNDTNEDYRLRATFRDLTKSVSSLSFSSDGRFLAASSMDGRIAIYSTDGSPRMVNSFLNLNSPPLVLVWGIGYELIVGLKNGRVCRYPNASQGTNWLSTILGSYREQKLDKDLMSIADLGKPITALTFHSATRRLFVAHQSGVNIYRRYSWGRSRTVFQTTFSYTSSFTDDWQRLSTLDPPPFDYTAVGFVFSEPFPVAILVPNWKDEVIVCYRDHGIRLVLARGPEGQTSHTRITGVMSFTRSARSLELRGLYFLKIESLTADNRCAAGLSPDSDHIAAWNLNDGIDLYNIQRAFLDKTETITLKSSNPTQVNAMLDVRYIQDGEYVLVGSNVGKPFILDPRTKKVKNILKHSEERAVASIHIAFGDSWHWRPALMGALKLVSSTGQYLANWADDRAPAGDLFGTPTRTRSIVEHDQQLSASQPTIYTVSRLTSTVVITETAIVTEIRRATPEVHNSDRESAKPLTLLLPTCGLGMDCVE
ncbi:hypothetical protein V5O48_013796 [Marasmius crinis-equi]|uniref:Uncharacterized protein n=1 Tax=Marasmius crinis-equi TaxID=585013 RepID=A0ABR3EZ37_9AGAR